MESDFSNILFPYEHPEQIDDTAQESDLLISKVYLKKGDSSPLLLISKPFRDHSEKVKLIQNFYFQYEITHPAVMPLHRLSLTPANRIDAFYIFPEKGKLSNFVGFFHEKDKIKKDVLTSTNKTIISYGIAHALRFIHRLGYQFSNLNAKNVYLDEKFQPFLTNFYSLKKMDNASHESSKISAIQIKADVYAYAIIYAALIEPIQFNPPVKSSKEFFENLSNRKRPVCSEATKSQKEILDKMWDYIPRDRIDFNQIITYFDNGDLIFPNTNLEEFNEYKTKINAARIYRNSLMSTPVKSKFSSAPSSTLSSPVKGQNTSPSSNTVKKLASSVINDE